MSSKRDLLTLNCWRQRHFLCALSLPSEAAPDASEPPICAGPLASLMRRPWLTRGWCPSSQLARSSLLPSLLKTVGSNKDAPLPIKVRFPAVAPTTILHTAQPNEDWPGSLLEYA